MIMGAPPQPLSDKQHIPRQLEQISLPHELTHEGVRAKQLLVLLPQVRQSAAVRAAPQQHAGHAELTQCPSKGADAGALPGAAGTLPAASASVTKMRGSGLALALLLACSLPAGEALAASCDAACQQVSQCLQAAGSPI